MGQANSAQQNTVKSNHQNSVLTNAQISQNINKLFRSQDTTMLESTRIHRTNTAVNTSSVEVDTILNGMKGGNNSLVSIVPKRQRFKNSVKPVQNKPGKTLFDSPDLQYVRDAVYGKHHGGNGNDANNDAGFSDTSAFTDQVNNDAGFSDTSPYIDQPDNGAEFSDTSAFTDQVGGAGFSDTSAFTDQVNNDAGFSDTSPYIDQPDNGAEFSDTSAFTDQVGGAGFSDTSAMDSQKNNVDPATIYSPTSATATAPDNEPTIYSPTSAMAPDNNDSVLDGRDNGVPANIPGAAGSSGSTYWTPGQDGGNRNRNTGTIEQEINIIRKFIDNTAKQRGGSEAGANTNNNIDKIVPLAEKSKNTADILSDDGLDEIRQGLAKHGIVAQKGGNLDADLMTFKNKILNQDPVQTNDVFSVTSPDPINYQPIMKGGDPDKSKAKKSENQKKGSQNNPDKDQDDDLDEDAEEEEEEDDLDEDEDDDDDDDDDPDDENDTESQDGGQNDHKEKDKKKNKEKRNKSSSESSSSKTSTSTSSSSSDSDLNTGSIAVMHGAINRAMDRKKNNSKYLTHNYTVTSNSDRDYKIDNRPIYSSQSSDIHNSIGGSDYLNNLRNRDRFT
jgi:hypothetical protein